MNANGQTVNQNYNNLINGQENSYSLTNTQSILDITNALNNNMALLDAIQRELSVVNNVNQDNLIKREQLIKMQNEELMEQLRNLKEIQSNIENKNRYIEQINQNINNQQSNIYILSIYIFLSFILLIFIGAAGLGKITGKIFMYGLMGIGISFILVYIYSYDIFYVKSAITSLISGNPEARFGKALQSWSEEIKTNAQNEIYGMEKNWINNNCSCPPEEEESVQNNDIYAEDQNVSVSEQGGIFYYDGSTPQQLLTPTPQINNLENIEWVDYSQPIGKEYNFNLQDPTNRLKYDVSRSNRLVPNDNMINTKTQTTDL